MRRAKHNSTWLALNIGNSRLHWGWFAGTTLECAWDTDHLPAASVKQAIECLTVGDWTGGIWSPSQTEQKSYPFLPLLNEGENPKSMLPLYLVSVVANQTQLWQTYPNTRVITLDQLQLNGLYPTLGIDRALAVLGAGKIWGWPVLVIDAGTALTFTGSDSQRRLMGGAILPGLGLQLQSLEQRTAALPKIELPQEMPQRWALNTPAAIQSGVIYTVLAGIRDFIQDWGRQFPESRIALTGGDRNTIYNYLQVQYPEIAPRLITDPHLIFWGMQSVVQELKLEEH